MTSNQVVVTKRRSKNYPPAIWTPPRIRSVKTPYSYETHGTRLEELKQNAKCIFASTIEYYSNVEIMKLIDTVQQLGIAYHLEKEIKEALDIIYSNINNETDLSTVALEFRILRSSGFMVSSDVFDKFIDHNSGAFLENLSENVQGMINLYEASYLGIEGEDHNLEDAMNFSKKHLNSVMEKNTEISACVREQIRESLSVPLHWKMPKAEVRGYIDTYEGSETKNKVFLDLAKLNFNMIQSVYLKDIQELAKWWEKLNFKEKLPFARDRLTESTYYAMGCIPDPQFSAGRKYVAKFASLTTVLDDIYDTYGLFDELQQLTDVIDRWDTKAMAEELPEYMRIWCSALLDCVDEVVRDGFDSLNLDIRPYIQAEWKGLAKGYFLEAKWFYKNEMPSFDEYMENGWVSIAVPISMVYVYFGILIQDSKLPTDSIRDYFELWFRSDFVYLTSLLCRLIDDLGSSKGEMEEMTNAIQCYMIEEGVSEEQAIDHIWDMINDSWRKINKLIYQNPFPFPACTANITLNHARCIIRVYKYVDLFAAQADDNENTVASAFFHPIE